MKTKGKVKAKEARRKARARISDLFGGGESGNLLLGKYLLNGRVHLLIEKRHRRYGKTLDEAGYFHSNGYKWKVPYGVRQCLKQPLLPSQISNRYPWYVQWRSPKTGRRLKKYFTNPREAMVFIAEKAQRVDKQASLVSKHGYDIPHSLRGKIPAPWKWCPCCMTARRFRTVVPYTTFYAQRKEWIAEKSRYEMRDRKLRLMACTHCGLTNRDSKMRRSNQPWEVRKFKPGVRRARRSR